MDKEIEQSLIRSSAKGDHRAFRSLVEDSQAFAYALAFRFTHQHDEAEDIVQQAFIKVWNNIGRFDFSFRFKTWLGKIVTNLCLDAAKSARRKYMHMSSEVSQELHKTSGSTSDAVESKELSEVIWKLAMQLTDKQRAAFILRDLQQFEPEEVCKILKVSADNLKSNLYHARIKMKELLINQYGFKITTHETL